MFTFIGCLFSGLLNLYFGDDLKAFYFFENAGYNNHIMTPQDWAGFILTVLTIGGIVVGIIKFLIKHYLSELKPNSGSSLKDQVSRLENRLNEADVVRKDMDRKLDHMYDILIEYIAKSK